MRLRDGMQEYDDKFGPDNPWIEVMEESSTAYSMPWISL